MDAQGIASSFNRHRKIFQYRALRFARKDQTELSGFDEDFCGKFFANDRTLVSLLEEFRIVRQTSIIFLRKFTKCNLPTLEKLTETKFL